MPWDFQDKGRASTQCAGQVKTEIFSAKPRQKMNRSRFWRGGANQMKEVEIPTAAVFSSLPP
jgi:hypothetical protein